jgi:purine nucleoside permease
MPLMDSDYAAQYRSLYGGDQVGALPTVRLCDVASSDVYAYGTLLGQHMTDYTSLLTNGAGNYCMTAQEDNATLTALQRGADAHLLNFSRVLVLRGGAGFDRQFPGESAFDGLVTDGQGGFGAYLPAITNLYTVGSKVAHEIERRWDDWKAGPAAAPSIIVNNGSPAAPATPTTQPGQTVPGNFDGG